MKIQYIAINILQAMVKVNTIKLVISLERNLFCIKF